MHVRSLISEVSSTFTMYSSHNPNRPDASPTICLFVSFSWWWEQ